MSNQSGISAEQQLLDALNNTMETAENECIVLTAKISDDLTVVELADQFNSIEQLRGSLKEDPLYIFVKDLKRDPTHYEFISFVPDSSPVKLKMLYASTKNTVMRQIGSNSINKQVLCTEANDIDDFMREMNSNDGESDKSIAAKNEALLSESERIEIEINQQQRIMKNNPRGNALVSQTNGAPGQLSFDVVLENYSLLDELSQTNVVSFKIDTFAERVEIAQKSNISRPEDITIISEHPSYTIYANGEVYYFIYACPSGSKVRERMLYASNRRGFIQYLENKENLHFANVIEIGEPDELEYSLIANPKESDAKTANSIENANNSERKFNRPKGPSRRKRI